MLQVAAPEMSDCNLEHMCNYREELHQSAHRAHALCPARLLIHHARPSETGERVQQRRMVRSAQPLAL